MLSRSSHLEEIANHLTVSSFMTIIVLGGIRGSGKDTVGDILRDRYGFQKEAFANPLKAMVKHAFPAFTDDDLYGPSKNRSREYEQYPIMKCPRCGGKIETVFSGLQEPQRQCVVDQSHDQIPKFVTPRVALQTLGTEWGRRLYQDVWVDAAFNRIHQSQSEKPWAITDCRFWNEVRGSKRNGGLCVKLTRGLAESEDTHPSESEFRSIPDSEFHYILDNASLSLEELPEAVDKMLHELKVL